MTNAATASTQLDRLHFFIDGEWVKPQNDERHVGIDASTEQPLGLASIGGPADIDRAVRAAHAALATWSRTPAGERIEILRKFAHALQARGEDTAKLATRENGMPIATSSVVNGIEPAIVTNMAADALERTPLEEVRPTTAGFGMIRREAVGVVAAITPWNFPQSTAIFKIAPALATGSTVVLKHSPDAAFDSYVFAEAALEAGLPPGVLNVVLGAADAGSALVTHPLVDKIAFTGSTGVGRWIASEGGQRMRRLTLELGGKSAAIVCDDADLSVLYSGLGNASFPNNSQTCTTQSRILAPRARYQEVVDTVAQFARDLVVGDPLDTRTAVGPMAARHHLNKVMGYIDIANKSDARLVTGGDRPAGLDRGWFVEPTVFADVDNNDQLAREEVFGPVIAVIPYDGDDEAIAIANDSNYGLAGSVWSQDSARALEIARRVRTGQIGLNNYDVSLDLPIGGMKESGIGREVGPNMLEAYFEYKSVFLGSTPLS